MFSSCDLMSRRSPLLKSPWASKITPKFLNPRLVGKQSILSLGHSVITRQFGQLNLPPPCRRNQPLRQDLQNVCWHLRIFGSLFSLNCSWHTGHSSSFLISSNMLFPRAMVPKELEDTHHCTEHDCKEDWAWLLSRKSGNSKHIGTQDPSVCRNIILKIFSAVRGTGYKLS